MLRRPFSVFEVLRDDLGTVRAISVLNKRAGRTTGLLYDLEAGDEVACLGPLGLPFNPPASGAAWMVAGGVGLAPFATLAEALVALEVPTALFYGARTGDELYYLEFFDRLGIDLVLATEDGSVGGRGRITVPLEASLQQLSGPGADHHLRLRPRADAGRGGQAGGPLRPAERGLDGAHDGLRARRLLQLRGAGEARRRPDPIRALLHRRSGLRRRRRGLGLIA